jgi:hypothetical protein
MANEELFSIDESTLNRFAAATRQVEALYSPQRTLQSVPPSPTPTLSQRGWLLEPVSHGRSASVLLTHYNPGWSAYKIDQFGLWTTTATFTLTVQVGSVIQVGTFTNPSPAELQQAFAVFGLRAYCGNPVLGNYAGITCTTGKVDHLFWIITMPHRSATFSVTSNPNYLTDGRDIIGNTVSEIPVAVVTAFDALELDWVLNPGSRVILSSFDRGLGIVSARPSIAFSS